MKTQLVRIGNSRGVRIPKLLIEQAGLTDEIDIRVEGGTLLLTSVTKVREGWAKAFQRMHEQGDDVLLDGEIVNTSSWDEEEWQW